jgi:predicted transposase YbfD/YdcC
MKWVKFNTSIQTATPVDIYTQHTNNIHGRYETRIVSIYDDLYQIKEKWKTVNTIIKVESESISNNKTTYETRFYISNLNCLGKNNTTAKSFAHIIRSHWKIENSLHYVKDMAFKEDLSRMRTMQIPKIASLLRSMAINILNNNDIHNKSMARKLLAWGAINIFRLQA